MSTLENIYNQNYGTVVCTNGDYVAVGNPVDQNYENCQGFGKIGQILLYKKDNYLNQYKLSKILTNKTYSENGTLLTYYTEQSSSTSFTASFIKDDGALNSVATTCSYLITETGTEDIYQSKYGYSLDLSTYFMAVGDYGSINSYYPGLTSSKATVSIYEINPNYTYDVTSSVTSVQTSDYQSLETYIVSETPICVITGSPNIQFGKSLSISNNYLAVGAPLYNGGRGAVYIYRYTDSDCRYSLQKILSCSVSDYPYQYGFGFSISIDKKKDNILVIGSNQLSQSNVYLYQTSSTSTSTDWKLTQVFSQNTSSQYYKLQGSTFELFPSGSQINTRFGYSVSLYDTVLAIGSPNDLIYWEYSGSNVLRQRGSVYVYENQQCATDINCGFELLTKLYGDDVTFKDNLFGYSVSVCNKKVLVGSPKPYFPFSSLFISSSINYYDLTFDQYDFGESTYCGQSLLYYVTGSVINQLTTDPISKRKEIGKPFNAFGYSVSVSDQNIVIGAPIPLNDDFYLSGILITESGSRSNLTYLLTSSYQSEDCNITSSFVYLQMEDCISCDPSGPISGALSGALSGACNNIIVFVDEQGDTEFAANSIFGKTYIYNLTDLQKNYNVGNIFYNTNTLIINNSGSLLKNLTLDPTNDKNTYLYMEYQSQISLHEKQYICTIEPGEFNVSTNPTSLTASLFDYGVINTKTFDFDNLDIILRYINYRISIDGSEKWWNNFVGGNIDESIFNFYSSSYFNYEENRLTEALKVKCSSLDFDVNGDGIANSQDGSAIWKYFIQDFTINNYQNYTNQRSNRKNYDDMFSFLNKKTGKFSTSTIKTDFFSYNLSSSYDPTGSYLAPYITTVGLYSGAELVAIAKLASPIKNTGEIPINIVVKWDT
jgi:hypothetical protein